MSPACLRRMSRSSCTDVLVIWFSRTSCSAITSFQSANSSLHGFPHNLSSDFSLAAARPVHLVDGDPQDRLLSTAENRRSLFDERMRAFFVIFGALENALSEALEIPPGIEIHIDAIVDHKLCQPGRLRRFAGKF